MHTLFIMIIGGMAAVITNIIYGSDRNRTFTGWLAVFLISYITGAVITIL